MMNKDDRDAMEWRRNQLDSEIDEMLKNMAGLVPTIKTAAINFAVAWASRAMEEVMLRQTSHAAELGLDRIKQLSRDIGAVAQTFPEVLAEKLDDAALWSHSNGQLDRNQPIEKLPPFERFISPLTELNDVVAETMVPIAELLKAAGFKAHEGSTWVCRNRANTRYIWGQGHSLFSPALAEAVGEYSRAHNAVLEKIRRLNACHRALELDDVKRMLDQVRQAGSQ